MEAKVQDSWWFLNDNNYDNAPPQAECSFEYTDSKKKVEMDWKTNKDK